MLENPKKSKYTGILLTSNTDQVRNVSEQFGSSDHNIVHSEMIVKEMLGKKDWSEMTENT